jgi:hypothetical protein
MSSPGLTDSAIAAFAAAVFEKPDPWVAEAYSDFDAEPLQFGSAGDIVTFTQRKLAVPKGLAFFFVVYPDMRGRAVRETIRLKPGTVPGHELRYTWRGWGLISIQLTTADPSRSRVAANSLARALKWQSTYPGLDPPSSWEWKAVASHTRRLQRVLKSVTSRKVA